MLDLERLKQLCQKPSDDGEPSMSRERYNASARTALPALVEELERVYAVLEKCSPPLIVVEPDLLLKKFGSTWGVFHKGTAVGGFPTFREALHRAWGLEKQHAEGGG